MNNPSEFIGLTIREYKQIFSYGVFYLANNRRRKSQKKKNDFTKSVCLVHLVTGNWSNDVVWTFVSGNVKKTMLRRYNLFSCVVSGPERKRRRIFERFNIFIWKIKPMTVVGTRRDLCVTNAIRRINTFFPCRWLTVHVGGHTARTYKLYTIYM